MVRWRCCLVLAMLLLLPARTSAKGDDEDEDERAEENEEEDDDEEDDEDEDTSEKAPEQAGGRRSPGIAPSPKSPVAAGLTRTIKKRPLECFVCAYKAETPLRACLDPTKFRVHTITCHSMDDKCFTSVISKGNAYEAVVRGCRSSCVGSPETTCCELNRCNNQAFAIPLIQPRALAENNNNNNNKSTKSLPPNVVFFVTILLVLQTVVKVPFV